ICRTSAFADLHHVGFEGRVNFLQINDLTDRDSRPRANHLIFSHDPPLRQVGAVDHARQTFVVALDLQTHGAHDLEVVVDLWHWAWQRYGTGSHTDQR